MQSFFSLFSSHRNRRWLFALFFILVSVHLLASAGGGGGGGGGDTGDDDGGLFVMAYYILTLIPFPYNIMVLAGVIVIYYFGRKALRANSGLNKIASFDHMPSQASVIPPDFLQRNPQFDEGKFREKVQTAFLGVQDAWMKQELAGVRKWISDGVWQRFHTQFIMMRALGQQNTMSDIRIKNMHIADVQRDGNYDLVDVAIHFTMMDNFTCERFPQLNQEGALENVEYWTFMRKSGVQEKDLFHSENCPSCGSQLPKNMGEVGKCEHCGTITTLGDYDWVLSEITQAADYANENDKLDKNGALTGKIRNAMQHDADFCVQLAEDKASNAYMQVMTALVTKQPERMRRFVSDELFGNYSGIIKSGPTFVFNRLYLNNVTLMDFYRLDGKDHLVIALRRTSQRVDISSGKLQMLDYAPYATNEVMVMSRDTGAGKAKGSLYAHSCPSCAGPIGDTLDLRCSYCGAEVNSTKHEWIVTKLVGTGEYASLVQQQHAPLTTNAGTDDLDPIFEVRDYAMNNVMLMIALDGEFKEHEIEFSKKLAKKMGYDDQKMAGLFDLARNRQLTLRLPEDRKKAEKVYHAMLKAASADGKIGEDEMALLGEVQTRIGMGR